MSWRIIALVILAAGIIFNPACRPIPSSVPNPDSNGDLPPVPVPTPQVPRIVDDAPLQISLPIKGLKLSDIRDTFDQSRQGIRMHGATDIMAPRGTPVLAVNDGKIEKLFLSKPGGITIYQFDPSARYCYYYAHLDRYADGIAEGTVVHRGDPIAYVGSTGNANPASPHLHFEIHRLDADKHWYQGVSLNPYPYLVKALQ